MPKEKNPFKDGALSVVNITHEGPSHNEEVIGPEMGKLAVEFHRRMNNLHRGGMCSGCVAMSMFSTLVVNILGGYGPEDREDLVGSLHMALDKSATALSLSEGSTELLMIDVTSPTVDDLIANIKKMH